jgi:hypothetical protein
LPTYSSPLITIPNKLSPNPLTFFLSILAPKTHAKAKTSHLKLNSQINPSDQQNHKPENLSNINFRALRRTSSDNKKNHLSVLS